MTEKRTLTKNQRRRLKKKLEKQQGVNGISKQEQLVQTQPSSPVKSKPQVNVEYVSLDFKKDLALPEDDPAYEEFMRIFGKFSSAEELCAPREEEQDKKDQKASQESTEGNIDTLQIVDDEDQKKLSRKQKKKIKRLTVAELKQLVPFPDAVEAHDVTSADPRFLVFLKSYRNTVPIPRHWCHKRKYLQGKRGVEKQPFALPEFIAQTGIGEVRGIDAEEDAKKKSKQKARDRVAPKMGRVDIDYQVLHDAFFRYQTKPKLTILGDLYYEGKEFEVKLKTKVPGILSDDLKQALGMVEGVPPPWLLNVQRYGPPPAYPNLKIPGLNAPIPEGASFGYHPGGWGKPPVDENGNPLYGNVFGKSADAEQVEINISKEKWGEFEEVEEEEEEEGEEEEEQAADQAQMQYAASATGMETPLLDGISSVASSGLATPGMVDLRKGIRGNETPDMSQQQLYTVLEQKDTSVGTSLYGSGHKYVVPGTTSVTSGTESTTSSTGRVRRRFEDAPTPSEVDEDEAAKKKKKAKADKKNYKDFKF